jgi:uncharacterized repeat protein (TIGR02543 family)
MATISNGTLSGAETVGWSSRSTTTDISLPTLVTSWAGTARMGITGGNWRICESSTTTVALYARLSISGYGMATQSLPSSSTTVTLANYTATPPSVNFDRSAGIYVWTPSGTTKFNVSVSVWKNSAGTTATNNVYGPDTDDSRMGLLGGVSGSYWASIDYATAPSAIADASVSPQVSHTTSPTVSFTAPANGGSAITSYKLAWVTDNTSWGTTTGSWTGTQAAFTSGSVVSGSFASNTAYYFRVISTNAVDDSPYSNSTTAWYYRTVNINANSGSAPSSTVFYPNNGASITLPAATTRAGYKFGGWNTAADGSGTTYAAGSSYTASGDITLYAMWIPTTPKIHNGASFVRAATSKIWNGTAWVDAIFKVYDGTTWKDPT